MTTRLQFDFPDQVVPYWATNANRTLSPDDTLGDTVPIVKEDGWQIDTKPPAKVMNYLTHYVTEWLRRSMAGPVSNWFANPQASTGTDDFLGVVFSPSSSDEGDWTITTVAGDVWRAPFGSSWVSIASMTSAPPTNAVFGATVSANYKAIFGTINGLEYNSTGSTFVQVTNATIGGGVSGGIFALDTNGDRTIVVDSAGSAVMRIAPTGVNGSWVSPAASPSLGTASRTVCKIIHGGNSKWFAVSTTLTPTMHFAVSLDNGAVWSNYGLPAYAANYVSSVAYDPASDRVVTSGADTGVSQIYYSDNNGISWSAAVMPPTAIGDIQDLYSCGGGMWAALTSRGGTTAESVYVSLNNAETWYRAEMHDTTGATYYSALMSDGRKLLAGGTDGHSMRSLAYPDFR